MGRVARGAAWRAVVGSAGSVGRGERLEGRPLVTVLEHLVRVRAWVRARVGVRARGRARGWASLALALGLGLGVGLGVGLGLGLGLGLA